MSLVEGHAEYVMDGVGPDVVPSVATLRKRFAQRRKGRGPLDRVLRRLLGPRAEDEAVRRRAGRSSAASSTWSAWRASTGSGKAPANLPLIEELTDPARWVERVHGRPAIPA